jgi:hypothetical protein
MLTYAAGLLLPLVDSLPFIYKVGIDRCIGLSIFGRLFLLTTSILGRILRLGVSLNLLSPDLWSSSS